MSCISCILRALVAYSLVSSISSIRTEQPLIFQPVTLDIYPDWLSVPQQVGPYAMACPANEYNEVEFNRNGSLDHKSLFVQDYFPNKPNSVDKLLCFEEIKLAVVLHTDPKSDGKFIEFGFEVFIDPSIFVEYFKKSDFKHFRPLYLPSTSITRPDFPFIVKANPDTLDDSTKSTINEKLDFVWVPKAAIKYDFSTWNVQSLTYWITLDASELWKDCRDELLGIQFYGTEDLKKYYSTSNQKEIFDKVTLPEYVLRDEGHCKLERECVMQYNLLSPYLFEPSPRKRISCSQLSTIPVWEETAGRILDYSEKFLVAVADVADLSLKIIVGTYKTLTFPIKDDNRHQEMYLNHQHRRKKLIPISKIVYKIVKYKSHDCDETKELCWFDIVIVIHNEPDFSSQDVICEDISQQWGWESIHSVREGYEKAAWKTGFIYCCQLNEDMQNKLGYKNDTPIRGDLKLNNFPKFNKKVGGIQYHNWQGNIEQKINRIVGTY